MTASDLPAVLAGPILRRITPEKLNLWLATSLPVRVRLDLSWGEDGWHCINLEPGSAQCRCLIAGQGLCYILIDAPLPEALPADRWVGYSLAVQPVEADGEAWLDWEDWAPDLAYPGRGTPGFQLPSRVRSLMHGSCRKPHQAGRDAMERADELLGQCLAQAQGAGGDACCELPSWPSLLILTGDQVYADDVAGPMLRAAHRLIEKLGLPIEELPAKEETDIGNCAELYQHRQSYYRREELLPRNKRNYALLELFFGGVEKPVFTTASAHNHLVTLGEVLAVYLLSWSPSPWDLVDLEPPQRLSKEERDLYAEEQAAIEGFIRSLPAVRRLFAHIPVAMIFDDHDITDDWNLSREWEEHAYGHPFSRRILGNALIAYLINQGWGNQPEAFDAKLLDQVQRSLQEPGGEVHDACIARLQRFERWHYGWPTRPALVVLDTRTRRWRSEAAARRPSGLMDWEALTELQQELLGKSAVILVSAAPIFGVKLIEAVQRLFTWIGRPLMVDAENWMAHRGAAQAMLNIFRHQRTPGNFVILSGDVHYSFVYDIELRGRIQGPDVWQICSSGVRNEFPPRLISLFDRLDGWLYGPGSPLNRLTKRRRMRVIPREIEGAPAHQHLLNGSSIGLVELDRHGLPWRIRELLADGRTLEFKRPRLRKDRTGPVQ